MRIKLFHWLLGTQMKIINAVYKHSRKFWTSTSARIARNGIAQLPNIIAHFLNRPGHSIFTGHPGNQHAHFFTNKELLLIQHTPIKTHFHQKAHASTQVTFVKLLRNTKVQAGLRNVRTSRISSRTRRNILEMPSTQEGFPGIVHGRSGSRNNCTIHIGSGSRRMLGHDLLTQTWKETWQWFNQKKLTKRTTKYCAGSRGDDRTNTKFTCKS